MNTLIIKLGGSVLYDENLNFNISFVKKIVAWFKKDEDKRVVFVVGGGKLSRFLLNQVQKEISQEFQKHRLGISVTNVNATMVCSLFNSENVKKYSSVKELVEDDQANAQIIGGLVEGWSTDMVAAKIAKELKVQMVRKISNIDYVYSADPKVEVNAKPLENISWEEYIRIFNSQIGFKHAAGMNAPIDIKCSEFCKNENITFRVSGGNLEREIDEILNTGTIISG